MQTADGEARDRAHGVSTGKTPGNAFQNEQQPSAAKLPYALLVDASGFAIKDCDDTELSEGTALRRPGESLTIRQLTDILDAFIARCDSAEMVYFTEAHAIWHPQLVEFIDLARTKGIPQVALQCNGLRIAHDDDFLASLRRLKPAIFLELDGFDETTSLIMHGRRDLPFEAMRALDRLANAGLVVTILTRIERGVNLQEIGAIATYGLKHPAIVSAAFRPIMPEKSRLQLATARPVSADEIIDALIQGTSGLFSPADFIPGLNLGPTRYFVARMQNPGQQQPAHAGQPRSASGRAATLSDIKAGTKGEHAHAYSEACFWLAVQDFAGGGPAGLPGGQQYPPAVFGPEGEAIPCFAFQHRIMNGRQK